MNQSAPHLLLAPMDIFRPRKSFADYAALTICPVLIMVVVGSLVFFLLEIGYAGSHLAKLRWTLFWFVLAMVLISRIAIERGHDHAGIYALGLAAATAFVLTQYVNNFLPAWFILGLIWWATNKLTWDCTLIDEDVDASGEGLLQAARLDLPGREERGSEPHDGPGRGIGNVVGNRPSLPKAAKPRWWKRVRSKATKDSAKPHAPGLWVLYFSLGALPAFGFGQGLIPSADSAGRERAFWFVLSYVAAALGLLLITSFLGLRRYLRQRRLEMPSNISAAWVRLGSTLGVGILVGCILLPRPNATWSFGAVMERLGDRLPRPSKQTSARTSLSDPSSTSPGGHGEQAGRGTQASEQAPRGPATGGEQGKDAGTQSPQEEQSQGGGRTTTAKTGPVGRGPTGQPNPSFRAPPLNIFQWAKLGFYAAIVLLGLLLLVKNARLIASILRAWWAAFCEFWRNLFRRPPSAPPLKVLSPRLPARPFSAFSNPFSSGASARMSPQELVVYTFDALGSWAESYQHARLADETPLEFSNRLAEDLPDIAVEARQLARLYAQVAYAGTNELPPCRTVLEIVWSKMSGEFASA